MSLLNQCSESGGRNTRYNGVDCIMEVYINISYPYIKCFRFLSLPVTLQ